MRTSFSFRTTVECYQDSELDIKEIICRIVLERLVVAKPHPHGLLSFTFDLFRHQNVLDEIFVQKVGLSFPIP